MMSYVIYHRAELNLVSTNIGEFNVSIVNLDNNVI